MMDQETATDETRHKLVVPTILPQWYRIWKLTIDTAMRSTVEAINLLSFHLFSNSDHSPVDLGKDWKWAIPQRTSYA